MVNDESDTVTGSCPRKHLMGVDKGGRVYVTYR